MAPVFISLSAFASIETTVRTAKLYAKDKVQEPPVFTQKTTYIKDGPKVTSKTEVIDASGKLVMREDAVYEGTKVYSHIVDLMKNSEAINFDHFDVQVRDGKVVFTGNTKDEEKESLPENFTTGPVLEEFLRAHWDELMNEDTVHSRFAVPQLHETVGFKFWMRDKTKLGDREVVRIGMKPTSFIIALVISTIDLHFDLKDRKIMKFTGRTPLHVTINGKHEPFDSEVFYQ